jgi:hypothetical protein
VFTLTCFVWSGGAGGKGVWGKPGEELGEEGNVLDSHDPNYDSDSLVRNMSLLCCGITGNNEYGHL